MVVVTRIVETLYSVSHRYSHDVTFQKLIYNNLVTQFYSAFLCNIIKFAISIAFIFSLFTCTMQLLSKNV